MKTPTKAARTAVKPSRDQLNRTMMRLYPPFMAAFPDTRFVDLLQDRYGVREVRLMTIEQVEDLVRHLEERIEGTANHG